jgi:hypothetical protein
MQFKNPEILYLLFLLIIPILIHLFQLQRFQKVAFTNVKLLQQIEQQTRKSSKLKKRLILATRLAALSCLILAFAQPFFSKLDTAIKAESIIYLDNSFSMQAKGENGELLQKAKTDIISAMQQSETTTTLITNDKVLRNLSTTTFKNELLKTNYSPIKKDINTVLLQAKNSSGKKNTLKNIFLISDFQTINTDFENIVVDSLNNFAFIQVAPKKAENSSIDSVWIAESNPENLLIKASIKSYNSIIENQSISLFINDNLSGKAAVNVEKNTITEIEFNIPFLNSFYGKLILEDNLLPFDNTIYFNTNEKAKTKVLAIGENTNFLSKIYTEKEFDYTSTPIQNFDYSAIFDNNLIVLNQLTTFPTSLQNALKSYLDKDGKLVIIPAQNSDLTSYANLFRMLQIGTISTKNENKKLVTNINYEHPFFKNVFKNKIDNFNYPFVNESFTTQLNQSTSLLEFADKSSFISEIKYKNSSIYWIASPLDSQVSNFVSSPLIVPVFYNFGLQTREMSTLYYTIGANNEISIPTKNEKEEILQLSNSESSFIPLQTKTSNQIKIKTDTNPEKEGIYQIKSKDVFFQNVAFNYDRKESNLTYFDMKTWVENFKNASYFESVEQGINTVNDKNKKHNLWQLFIIFVLLFLGIEILLQKFLKS